MKYITDFLFIFAAGLIAGFCALTITKQQNYIIDKSEYECQGIDVTTTGTRCLAYVSKHSEVAK